MCPTRPLASGEYRTRDADQREQKRVLKLTVSNAPEPRQVPICSAVEVKSLYSVGIPSEGVGPIVTAASVVEQVMIALLASDKAMPGLGRPARGYHQGHDGL